jgi:PPK2 family polyphosphate:nucleotide phosphotransferase
MPKRSDFSEFRAVLGEPLDLATRPTMTDSLYKSKKDYQKQLEARVKALGEQQERLYASDRHSILVIFQAMDTAGKDGAIKHVMSGINPQGCQVFSFKHPSAEDLDHDFLWRTTSCLPERGRIGIFNRSYYEELLVVRVHPEILQGQRLPDAPQADNVFWEHRYRSINEMEAHLSRNGTRILKFFLHVSKEEQRERLLARIDEPDRNWKFSEADVKERAFWAQYQHAYEQCLMNTSTREAPWYVVPADDKKNARLLVSGILLETLYGMGLQFPSISAARRAELKRMRKQLSR